MNKGTQLPEIKIVYKEETGEINNDLSIAENHNKYRNYSIIDTVSERFIISAGQSEEDCTHELRKLYWALGRYFKIIDPNDK